MDEFGVLREKCSKKQQCEDTNKRESRNLKSATQRELCLCFIELLAAINTAEFPQSPIMLSQYQQESI